LSDTNAARRFAAMKFTRARNMRLNSVSV
jgi:hypothetical protein